MRSLALKLKDAVTPRQRLNIRGTGNGPVEAGLAHWMVPARCTVGIKADRLDYVYPALLAQTVASSIAYAMGSDTSM